MCVPASPGKHPLVLVLGGSGGGDRLAPFASAFAKRGYVGASIAYFRMPGLPASLDRIPAETVTTAIDRLVARPDVDPARVAILGDSKGGEFALLVASIDDRVRGAISMVGSPFGWGTIPPARSRFAGDSSWTIKGRPLAFVKVNTAGLMSSNVEGFERPMNDDPASVQRAMFALENIHGPVLFLSGDEDRIWPSRRLAEVGMEYLRVHHHPYADESVHYANAGHAFLFATESRPETELGGTAGGNLIAGRAAAQKIDDFLAALFSAKP